ncbi:MAG: class I SAM-dependent methyltransferase [Thermoleophilaceae bacterium]|nr:class I SAM-dependent methyltransferase [Thermoleophilaceae bacterium]
MPETTSCNLCGSHDAKRLFTLRDYRFQTDDIEWPVVRCRACGLGFLNPRPDAEEMGRYYPPAYFERRGSQTARYERQAGYVPGPPGRLLDVGTARGDFLSVMRERGWQVEGIEPARRAGNPHGLIIHRLDFPPERELPHADFDVITAWAVFEHLRDPAAAFAACAALLRPGGRLIVQVPNLRSVYSRWAQQEDVPRHLHFFTPRTLRRYGAEAGLRLKRVVHTTDLFGGSGRGVLRLALVRTTGGSQAQFFEIWRTPKRERFRRWPVLATGWTMASAIERVALADPIVRALRISGQIVTEFTREGCRSAAPPNGG